MKTPVLGHVSKKMFFVLFSVIIILLLLLSGYFFYQYQLLKNQLQTNSVLTKQQTQQLLSSVGKLILLPHDTPTIFTVTDVVKLQIQPFFKEAQNGDRLLIYGKEGEAILYRPSKNILIKVGPIATAPQAQQSLQQAIPQPVTVGLLNGTPLGGRTTTVAQQIQHIDPQAVITFRRQAHSLAYLQTLLIIMNPVMRQAAQTIATKLHATIAPLPQGEIVPTTVDLLVIVGKNQQ